MSSFGTASRKELASCDTRLQQVAHKVILIKDHSALKGHRPKDEQNAAFATGRSKLEWPDGKHNGLPSKALDVQTYPLPEAETKEEADQMLREEQLYLLGLYVGIASEMGITLRTGADWDKDGEIADNGFDDFYHAEIVGE